MPLHHYVHVVGFDVPVDREIADATLIVLLDKSPVDAWRHTFEQHAAELVPELQREVPVLLTDTVQVPTRATLTRRQAGDIRAFVDRINRLTFLDDKGRLLSL